jgi:methylmalonyl-CoA/ethylmalonyl-CoA epimerase
MTTDPDLDAGSLGLPPIYQVGYVVHDVDATVAAMNPIFGPFDVFESDESVEFRGVPTPVHLKIAIGHSGAMEVEFIEVISGDSPHREWLDQHGECVMHVAFKVTDVDAELARLADHGYETVWRGGIPEMDIVYAYARGRDDIGGHYLELTQGF